MECCRNVLLPLVYEEANRQLQKGGAKSTISIADVVAYSLNRIPPLFIAREAEWEAHRQLFPQRMGEKIAEVVYQGILQARKPRLESVTPLSTGELLTPMLSLLRLRELLKKPQMTWSELPQTLETCLLGINRSSGTPSIKMVVTRKEETEQLASSADYEGYLLPATMKMVHGIEQLVHRLSVSRLETLPPKLAPYARLIRVDEVVAAALNCLPPMYATTYQGLKRLRYHSRMQIGSQIAEVVTRAVITIGQEASKNFAVPPLLFQKIRQERQEGIARVNWMLKRKDITWENSHSVILEAIDRLRLTGELDWQRITPMAENG
ncbi:MAG: late competence development ComFB family protein [Cyanobacteria bacterium KgW148]|nr:late competence development ComFB family protein [Cyanobacteria bacterium KgW148]